MRSFERSPTDRWVHAFLDRSYCGGGSVCVVVFFLPSHSFLGSLFAFSRRSGHPPRAFLGLRFVRACLLSVDFRVRFLMFGCVVVLLSFFFLWGSLARAPAGPPARRSHVPSCPAFFYGTPPSAP